MRMDNVKIIQSVNIPTFTTDPTSGSLTSPGLIWYNDTSGSIRYTYNATGSPGVYCIKSVNYT
jgi:hypothetical protein